MSKESLARATNSTDLTVESGAVHDADRLAAMATGDALGGLLLRFRESDQLQWGRRIALVLANRIIRKFRLEREIATRTAIAALEEYWQPHCIACGGAGALMLEQLRVVCEPCHGSGKQRYTDGTRRARIGTYGTRIGDAMAFAHQEMANGLGAYLGHAAGRLE